MSTGARRYDRGESGAASSACPTVPADPCFAPAAAVQSLEAGMVLGGRYELGAILGTGGAGRVFAAFDRALNERVALKVLRGERAEDRSWIRRLAREVKIARLIRHPNVCRVLELGNDVDHWFITMELAEGGTLREALRTRPTTGDPPWPVRLAEARAVCAGLAAMHAVGIVHRDVTPQNVLRMADGRLVLSDFGLAIGAQESTTFVGGTPRYMAPEVVAGARADQRSDVYQLGMLLHEVLFGRRPEWREVGSVHALESPVDADTCTPVEDELAALCADCLQASPAARPANAVAVAGRLAAAERAQPRRPWARLWRRATQIGRSPAARWLSATALLLAVGAYAGRTALRPRPCSAGPARVARVWGSAQKESVRKALLASGMPSAAGTFETVDKLLDEHVQRWLEAYSEACEATLVRGEQTPDVLDLRMSCLNNDLDSMSAVTHVIGTAETPGHAIDTALHLDDLGRCADVPRLRTAPRLPTNPSTRRVVAEQLDRLNEAKALFEAGRYVECKALAEQIIKASEGIDYCPLMSRALALKAQSAVWSKEVGPALRAAARVSEACGDDRSFAMAAARLILVDGRHDIDAARTWFDLGNAALHHAGGDSRLESWLLNGIAVVRLWHADFSGSLDLLDKVLKMKEAQSGRKALDTLYSIDNMTVILVRLGRLDSALSMSQEIQTTSAGLLGLDEWDRLSFLSNRGEVLLAVNDLHHAKEAFAQIIEANGSTLTSDDPLVIEAQSGLGRIALAEGDANSAREFLEQALRNSLESDWLPPFEAADLRFALARALDAQHRNRGRARALVQEALQVYGQAPELEPQRREARRWLAARSPTSPRGEI